MTSLPDRLVVSLEVAFLDTDTTTVFGNAADGYLLPWPSLYDNQHILCYTKGPIPVMLYGDVRMGQKHFDRCVCEDQDEIMKLVGNSGVKCAAPFSTTNSNGLGASNASQMHYFVVSYENGQVLIFSFGRGQDKEKYVLQLVAHTQSNQDIDNIYPQPNVWQYDTVIDIMQHIWLYSQATNELSLLTFKHNTIDAKVTVQFNTSQGDQTDGDFGELHDVENINTALGYNALTAFHFKRQLVGGATITSFVVDARLVLHFAEKVCTYSLFHLSVYRSLACVFWTGALQLRILSANHAPTFIHNIAYRQLPSSSINAFTLQVIVIHTLLVIRSDTSYTYFAMKCILTMQSSFPPPPYLYIHTIHISISLFRLGKDPTPSDSQASPTAYNSAMSKNK